MLTVTKRSEKWFVLKMQQKKNYKIRNFKNYNLETSFIQNLIVIEILMYYGFHKK